ncbi:cytosolic phospholipase A2 epsilon-like [Meleagris gallopavo]|uniref:cytosolic phospholipase A2 epsilon-like n=1 Tax=Meleagris gallopavo TaxID=9103 RepID=UPI0012AB5B67|nr:cytosolic phospholipase A2 epsilon-like [Meleagris gallopavo]
MELFPCENKLRVLGIFSLEKRRLQRDLIVAPSLQTEMVLTLHLYLQNILELKVYDENTITKDDLLFTVLFDVAKIQLGETVRLTFQLNPEPPLTQSEWVRHELYFPCQSDGGNRSLLHHIFLHKVMPLLTSVHLNCCLISAVQCLISNTHMAFSAFLPCCVGQVPVVAITTTGGGTRSLTAMYGSLLGLQKLNLLDCISYIGGLSGTTWTMANLYEDADWSEKYLEEAIKEARKQVTKNKICCFSLDCLKYYYNDLMERVKEGRNTSFIDLWGLVIESMLHDKKDEHRLSDQRQAVDNGQNPLPIYVAINLKSNYSAQAFREWLEFTPYEVSLLKYGASIRAEHFGSEFFMGRLVKRLPETRICYMQGMWSSIFSIDVMYVWNLAADSEDFWFRWTRDRVKDIEEEPFLSMNPYEVDTCLLTPSSTFSTVLRDVLTGRPTIAQYPNFIRGLQMHSKYLESDGFSTWKDTVIDSFPNKLMETANDELSLVDTGFFINTSYPPLLRSKREVDVILHLNYSGGSQTLPLDQIAKYISGQGIPFPKIEISDEDRENLKECYVFEDAESPQVPTVLFFPLVNDTFKNYKAPGVERSPEEMAEGRVDVCSILSPFTTREVCFSEENFDKLVKLTDYNVLNNEKLIIQALRMAVARRKQRNY